MDDIPCIAPRISHTNGKSLHKPHVRMIFHRLVYISLINYINTTQVLKRQVFGPTFGTSRVFVCVTDSWEGNFWRPKVGVVFRQDPNVPGSINSLCWGCSLIPPLMTESLFHGALFSPLRTWVAEFIPYYMEMSWELINPIAHMPAAGPVDQTTCRQVYKWTSWD